MARPTTQKATMKRFIKLGVLCLITASLAFIIAVPTAEAQEEPTEVVAPTITKATYNNKDRVVVRFTAPTDDRVVGYIAFFGDGQVGSVIAQADERRLMIPADEMFAGELYTITLRAVTADGRSDRSNLWSVQIPSDHPYSLADNDRAMQDRITALLRQEGCTSQLAGEGRQIKTVEEMFGLIDRCASEIAALSVTYAFVCSNVEGSPIRFGIGGSDRSLTTIIPTLNGTELASFGRNGNVIDVQVPGASIPADIAMPWSLQIQGRTGDGMVTTPLSAPFTVVGQTCRS